MARNTDSRRALIYSRGHRGFLVLLTTKLRQEKNMSAENLVAELQMVGWGAGVTEIHLTGSKCPCRKLLN